MLITVRPPSRFLQPTSAHRTDATGSSSWPTPMAWDGMKGSAQSLKREGGPTLVSAVAEARWPTPTATDSEGSRRNGLAPGSHTGTTLTDAVQAWPIPTATDYGSTNNGQPCDGREAYATKGTPSLDSIAVREGGVLNPDWVEALMGFPVGWTKDTTQRSLFDGQLDAVPSNTHGSPRGPSCMSQEQTDVSG